MKLPAAAFLIAFLVTLALLLRRDEEIAPELEPELEPWGDWPWWGAMCRHGRTAAGVCDECFYESIKKPR